MKFSKWMKRLFRQRILIILILLVQLAFVVWSIFSNSEKWEIVSVALTWVSFFVALYVVNSRDKGAYKTSLVFLILLFPIFGGLFYILFKGTFPWRAMHRDLLDIEQKSKNNRLLPDSAKEPACEQFPGRARQIRYLTEYAGFPICDGAETRYFSLGDDVLPVMLEEMKKAEKYIFLEYFIIREGKMWDAIAEVLEERAAAGVDVRVIYDDVGCFGGLDGKNFSEAGYRGIRFAAFNRFVPLISTVQNNRDHRKILAIDGKVAFTGGVNIADEYINAIDRFGHWKDSALMVRGSAAWSFTVMFLQMWSFCVGRDDEAFDRYFPTEMPRVEGNGYVLPYTDSPMDRENVGEHVYLQLINTARKYLYITTPYLIIDDSTVSALTLAAKSGVDVRIITPYRYDKFLVHFTTRSYYRKLIHAGVKIYEYSPGFIHSKLFVTDDEAATVGTANMDFRSLYLHFECGAVMYGTDAVKQVKEDFLSTLEVCHAISLEECHRSWSVRLIQAIIRLFAPLM